MVAKLTVGSRAVTVTLADPLTVSLVAVIMTCWASARTPVTSPVPETVATAGLLLAHVTTRALSTLPRASSTVAASRTVSPTVRLDVLGATATDATAGGGAGAVESLPQARRRNRAKAVRHRVRVCSAFIDRISFRDRYRGRQAGARSAAGLFVRLRRPEPSAFIT